MGNEEAEYSALEELGYAGLPVIMLEEALKALDDCLEARAVVVLSEEEHLKHPVDELLRKASRVERAQGRPLEEVLLQRYEVPEEAKQVGLCLGEGVGMRAGVEHGKEKLLLGQEGRRLERATEEREEQGEHQIRDEREEAGCFEEAGALGEELWGRVEGVEEEELREHSKTEHLRVRGRIPRRTGCLPEVRAHALLPPRADSARARCGKCSPCL